MPAMPAAMAMAAAAIAVLMIMQAVLPAAAVVAHPAAALASYSEPLDDSGRITACPQADRCLSFTTHGRCVEVACCVVLFDVCCLVDVGMECL